MFKPLENIKVIDVCVAGAGPSCTKLLAEYGADVIWVEPLYGTSTRNVFKFDFYTTGKRSIAIDLKSGEGQAFIRRAISTADVFVSNYRTKALRHLGLEYEALHRLNPKLIYATLTGFGEEGPEADEPGYDPVAFWSKGGMLMDFAERGSLLVPPYAVGDIIAGQALAGGVLAALLNREKTGEGERVFTSLMAEAAYANHDAIVESQFGETYPKSRLAPRRALLNTYRCGDGKWITISLPNDFERYFASLLRVLDLQELVGDPRWATAADTMGEKAPELVRILDDAFAKLTRDEAIQRLHTIDVPCAKVLGTAEFMRDEQANANNCFYEIPTLDGNTLTVPANPVKFGTKYSGKPEKRGPHLGEQTEEILREYGYPENEIQAMLMKGSASQHGWQKGTQS